MSGISADGTDGTDGVPADADADDDAVLTLQALNIVTCAHAAAERQICRCA